MFEKKAYVIAFFVAKRNRYHQLQDAFTKIAMVFDPMSAS
jgi:hypothetical protein